MPLNKETKPNQTKPINCVGLLVEYFLGFVSVYIEVTVLY